MNEDPEYLPSDSDELLIPPVEVDMVVDEENAIVLNDDEVTVAPAEDTKSYGEELISSGLTSSDLMYFNRAYKNLDHVKFIRLHCTSCDKHIGSAPNQLQNRYEHPLLKVLICGKCFHFYSSGDFEKDEDGSELYCRWCGEGGQVFCCTKCPFVFCKRCITRNLGRGTATTIQNSDNWLCFSCNPDQISRHRATYWAIQKYSGEILRKAQETGDTSEMNLDGNICCTQVRKRTDLYDKLKTLTPPAKKRKVEPLKLMRPKHTDVTLNKTNTSATWSTELISKEPEAEVICTPDIIPIDDSPPGSPVATKLSPPPLVACSIRRSIAPKTPALQIPSTSVSVGTIHNQLKAAFTKQLYLAPASKLPPAMIQKSYKTYNNLKPKAQNTIPMIDNKFKIILKHGAPIPVQQINSSMIITPSNKNITNATVGSPLKPRKDDWFDQAVIHCAEVTEYITTKISALSDVHTRAYKSSKLMEELHNTLQTYLYVAIEKMHKVKKTMQSNYENECKLNGKDDQIINQFTENIVSTLTPKSVNVKFTPEKKKTRRRRKKKDDFIESSSEEELFDMDVVNESDEEDEISITSDENSESRPPSDNEDDDNHSEIDVSAFMEVQINQPSETISLIDTDDENENNNCESDKGKKSDLDKSEQLSSNDGRKSPLVIVKNAKEFVEMLKKNEVNDSENHNDINAKIETNETENNSDYESENDKTITNESDKEASKLNNKKRKTEQNTLSEDETHKSETENDADKSETNKNNGSPKEEKIDEDIDIEAAISSNVVLRQDTEQVNRFRDEFSKFIKRSDDVISDTDTELQKNINIAHELDVAEEMLHIPINDNGSLSLPPETITEYLDVDDLNGLKDCLKPNDLVGEGLENELLALKQMAENCVNAAAEKPSAECKVIVLKPAGFINCNY